MDVEKRWSWGKIALAIIIAAVLAWLIALFGVGVGPGHRLSTAEAQVPQMDAATAQAGQCDWLTWGCEGSTGTADGGTGTVTDATSGGYEVAVKVTRTASTAYGGGDVASDGTGTLPCPGFALYYVDGWPAKDAWWCDYGTPYATVHHRPVVKPPDDYGPAPEDNDTQLWNVAVYFAAAHYGSTCATREASWGVPLTLFGYTVKKTAFWARFKQKGCAFWPTNGPGWWLHMGKPNETHGVSGAAKAVGFDFAGVTKRASHWGDPAHHSGVTTRHFEFDQCVPLPTGCWLHYTYTIKMKLFWISAPGYINATQQP